MIFKRKKQRDIALGDFVIFNTEAEALLPAHRGSGHIKKKSDVRSSDISLFFCDKKSPFGKNIISLKPLLIRSDFWNRKKRIIQSLGSFLIHKDSLKFITREEAKSFMGDGFSSGAADEVMNTISVWESK